MGSRRCAVVLLVVIAAGGFFPKAEAGGRAAGFTPDIACTGDPAAPFIQSFRVDGERTRADVVLPATTPRGLLVLAHGYGGWATAAPGNRVGNALTYMARRLGVIIVGPEFRGTVPPASGRGPSRGMPVARGAADLIAVAQAYDAACPGLPTRALLAESMGALMSTVALTSAPRRPDGTPLFDAWIINSGVHDAVVLGAAVNAVGATGVDPYFAAITADAEQEAGGTVATAPGAYASWSAYLQTAALAARSGLRQVEVVHAMGDWVPVASAIATAVGLAGAGIPTRLSLETTDQGETCDPSLSSSPFAGDTPLSLTGLVPRGVIAGHSGDSPACRALDVAEQWFADPKPHCDLSVLAEARHARGDRALVDLCSKRVRLESN